MTETDETHSVEEGEASSSSTSSSASVGGSDRCPICLNVFRDEVVGTPETCSHTFCVECLYEWAQQTATCPVDRSNFDNILVKSITTSHLIRKIVVEKVTKVDSSDELNEDDLTFCEVCNRSDREDQLLLCDGCDAGYHLDCLSPPLLTVPIEEWFCPVCRPSFETDRRRTSRGIPRTRAAERLRSRIARRRERGVLTPSENLSPAEYGDESPLRYSIVNKDNGRRKPKKHISRRSGHSHRRRHKKRRKTHSSRKHHRHSSRRTTEERSKPRSVQSKLVATLGLRKADRYLFPQYHASLLSKGSASGSSSRSSMRLAFKGFLPFEGIEEPEGPRLPSRSEPRISNKAEAFNKPIRKAKNSNQAASAPAENDLLGKILEKQAVLGISSRDLTIGKDGSINVKDETQRKHSRHDELKKRDDRAPSSSAYDHTWRDRKKEMSRGGGDLRTVKGESASGVAERRCSHVASCSKSVQTPPAQPKSSLPFNSVDGESMDHSESEPLRSEAMYPRTDKKLLPPLPLHLIPFPTTRLLSDVSRDKMVKVADLGQTASLPNLLSTDSNTVDQTSNNDEDTKLFAVPKTILANPVSSAKEKRDDGHKQKGASFPMLPNGQNKPTLREITKPVSHSDFARLPNSISKAAPAIRCEIHVEKDPAKKSKVTTNTKDPIVENFRRAVERQVKDLLAPFYKKRKIDKVEYKYIMRKTVPKIWKKGGKLNSTKIQTFIEAYVKKVIAMKRRK